MFDIGWSEMVVIMLVALVVIGPKDLPRLARTLGQWAAKGRVMAREFQRSLEDMAREAELDDVKREIEKVGRTNIKKNIEKTIDPTGELGRAFDTSSSSSSSSPHGGRPPAKASGASAANGEAKEPAASRPELTSEQPAEAAGAARDSKTEGPATPRTPAKPKTKAKPTAEAASQAPAKPKTEAKPTAEAASQAPAKPKAEAQAKATAKPKTSARSKTSAGAAPTTASPETGKTATLGGPR